MYNVRKFLEFSSYETTQEARKRAADEGNSRSEDMIPIYRKRTAIDSSGRETTSQIRYARFGGRVLCKVLMARHRYYVVDSTEALSKFGQDAWDRVVCVMTTGQAWQFKPYKWSDPKVLFHHGASVGMNVVPCLTLIE